MLNVENCIFFHITCKREIASTQIDQCGLLPAWAYPRLGEFLILWEPAKCIPFFSATYSSSRTREESWLEDADQGERILPASQRQQLMTWTPLQQAHSPLFLGIRQTSPEKRSLHLIKQGLYL